MSEKADSGGGWTHGMAGRGRKETTKQGFSL